MKMVRMFILFGSLLITNVMSAQSLYWAKECLKEGRYIDAAKQLRPLVEEGDSEAQYLAAKLFFEGKGVNKSYDQGLKYLQMSVKQGYADAVFMLAECYIIGRGVAYNPEKAFRLMDGHSCEEEFKRKYAVSCWGQKDNIEDYADQLYALGSRVEFDMLMQYLEQKKYGGSGVTQQLKSLAMNGNAFAMARLAKAYFDQNDKKLAEEWAAKSVNAGSVYGKAVLKRVTYKPIVYLNPPYRTSPGFVQITKVVLDYDRTIVYIMPPKSDWTSGDAHIYYEGKKYKLLDSSLHIPDRTTNSNKQPQLEYIIDIFERIPDDAKSISLTSGVWVWKDVRLENRMTQEDYFKRLVQDMVYVDGGIYKKKEYKKDKYSRDLSVEILPYSICKYEVTQGLWGAVMGLIPLDEKAYGTNYPVTTASWDDCQKFIAKLNKLTGRHYRLPSNEEWLYAYQGGVKSLGYKYSGGNDPNDVAWNFKNSENKHHPVGLKKPNELGLYDMAGNVKEFSSSGDVSGESIATNYDLKKTNIYGINYRMISGVLEDFLISKSYGNYGLRLAEDAQYYEKPKLVNTAMNETDANEVPKSSEIDMVDEVKLNPLVELLITCPSMVKVGSTFQVQFTVNTQDVSDFQGPSFDGFEVLNGPSTSSKGLFRKVDGKTIENHQITFTYTLKSKIPCTYIIGSASVKVDGRIVRSKPFTLDITLQEQIAPQDLFITTTLSKPDVKLGDSVLLTYKVYTTVNLTQLNGKILKTLDGLEINEVSLPQTKEYTIEKYNGRNYHTVVWSQYELIPQRVGDFTIPSISYDGVVVPSQSLDPFNAFFNSQSSNIEVKKNISAPAIRIHVSPK